MANYRITPQNDLAAGGAKAKAKQNIAAINVLRQLELEQREATPEKQSALVNYSGWGAAPDIFTGKEAWKDLQNQLKELLTEEEYAAARASTLNAHYTDPVVVNEIYAGLERLGFTGGRILDPSMGASGIFEGMMPDAIAQSSKITGIELDSISGRIATYLYPEAIVHINGFQDVELPDDYFDLSISNIPFSEVGVVDPDYNGTPAKTLHDYFFAKGLDKVRPGGLVAYITSTGTMQAGRGEKFRKYLAERANLVGAIRLPGDAFKKIANTDVTTDIVILQKLGGGVNPNGINWTGLLATAVSDADGKALLTNEYFVNNPTMMLGTLADDKLYPGRLAMKGDGRDIAEAISQAFQQLPTGIYQQTLLIEAREERTLVPPELQTTLKQDAYTLYKGQLMVRERGYLEPIDLVGKQLERAIGLIAVREATENVLNVQLQNGTNQDLAVAQAELNKVYDKFVKDHGYVSKPANKNVFVGDPSYPLLLALENYNRETKEATKTDIFSKRTIQPYVAKETAETAKEGLLYSLNERGRVDVGYVANLAGISKVEAIAELQKDGLIFLDPDNDEWQTQDEYLSGNVRQKLSDAIAAEAAGNPQFSYNIEALKAVQPELIPPGDIDVRLGSSWIPSEDVRAFIAELLEADLDKINVADSKAANTWYVSAHPSVSASAANTKIHGSSRRTALVLIETALNLNTPVVYDYDSDGSRTLNIEDTAAAKLKFEEIREKFKNWVWEEPKRTERLTSLYNEKFNKYRERQFNGSHLELPGKNQQITLRPHQLNAVWRSLSGSALFAHAVGAGKTYSMIAAAMEQKRLGLAQKPMIVVPNHLLEQISADCKLLYPASNVLAATKKDSSKQNRQHLMSRIATGNWDIVLITHSAFGKLRLSDQTQTAFYKKAWDEVEGAIRDASSDGSDSRRLMKDLERSKERLQNKIKAVADNPNKDDTVNFEHLGVDLLIVDESHYFKNLLYITKMRDVAGLPNSDSNRAMDMLMKVQYISTIRGEGKGVIFATGTPVTNSIAELYTIQRYLQPEVLKDAGIDTFDNWASTFGDTVTALELTPAGEFKLKTRFARFVNVPELMTMARQTMDVQTLDMLNLPVPQLAGGKPTVVAVPATDAQLAYMEALVKRAKNLSGVDPSQDNMLVITSDGRKMSATMKLFDPDAPDDPDSKLSRLVEDTAAYWHEHKGEKTHLIFCDLGTPKTTGLFSIYRYVKEQCVKRGVPVEKIAFAQDANSDAQKLDLQKKFNTGEIAILIGGASIETGFNGQKRLGRVSHYTVPWRPDQIEQRDGRALRQGNRNPEVESFRYTTQGRNGQLGIDGYLWKTLKTKKIFADQAMRGNTTQRRIDDISTDTLSYSELEGIATGNPLIMEKATIDNEIAQLSIQKRAQTNNQYSKRKALAELPKQILSTETAISKTKEDLASANSAIAAGYITLWGNNLKISNVDVIGKQIRSRAAVINKVDEFVKEPIGMLGNLSLFIQNGLSTELLIEGKASYRESNILQSKQGAYDAVFGVTNRMEESIGEDSNRLNEYRQDLEALSRDADKPFAKEAELQAALKRQSEIYSELDSIGKEKSSNQPRVKASKDQPDLLTRRIARFLENADIHAEVRTSDGFTLILKNEDSRIPVTVDTADGETLTIQSEVTLQNGKTEDIRATFSISDEGILAPVLLDETDATRPSLEDINQLAAYLAVNVFDASIPTGAVESRVETENSSPQKEDRQTMSEQSNPLEKPPTGADQDGIFVRLQDTKLAIHVAEFIVKHNLRQSVLSNKGTSALFESIENKAPTTLITSTEGIENFPHAKPDAGSKILTIDSEIDWPNREKTQVTAKFLTTQSGRLQALEISSATSEQRMSSLALEAQLGVYLALNKLTRSSELAHSMESEAQAVLENTRLEQVTEAATNPGTHPSSKLETVVTSAKSAESDRNRSSSTANGAEPEEVDETIIYKTETIIVSRNIAAAGIEVRFTDKPSSEWTDRLGKKGEGMRFSTKNQDPRWYGKEARLALDKIVKIAEAYHKEQTIDGTAITPESSETNAIAEYSEPANSSSLNEESTITNEIDEELDPGFRRYLETKKQNQKDIVLIRTPRGYFATYQDDAALAAQALGLSIAHTPSGSTQYGKVPVVRIFQGSVDESIQSLQKTHSVAVRSGDDVTVHPQTATAKPLAVKQPREHKLRVERNISKLLHQTELALEIMGQDDFHFVITNGAKSPLTIESHCIGDGERLLYLINHIERDGIKKLDSELVLRIDLEGELTLLETATRNPLGGTDLRIKDGGDRTFASIFSKNLLSYKLDEAAKEPNSTTAVKAEKAVGQDKELPEQTILASSLIQETIQRHDPQLHLALSREEPSVSADVDTLRDWYCAVKAQRERDTSEKANLLEVISEKGKEAKDRGTTQLTETESSAMRNDISWFTDNHPEVDVGKLRTWYRANMAIAGGTYTGSIQQLARNLEASGGNSIHLRPTDHMRMEKDVNALQKSIAAKIEPSLRSIWNVVTAQNLVSRHSDGSSTCPGTHYTIVESANKAITLIRNQDGCKLAIDEAGNVSHNDLALSDAEKLQAIAKELATEVAKQRQPADVQA